MISCARLLALPLLVVAGCGGLETGAKLDRPTFSMKGAIAPPPVADDPLGDGLIPGLRIGLLWIDPAPAGEGSWASGDDLVAASIAPDGAYALDLRQPAPPAAVRTLVVPGSSTRVAYAFAELVLYEDRDGDGRFDVGPLSEGSSMIGVDVYRGMPTVALLFYVRDPLPGDSSSSLPELTGVIDAPGYHLGVVNCGTNTISAFDPPVAALTLTPPSALFPDLRRCLRSHPTTPPTP